jgi:hypothetical protein
MGICSISAHLDDVEANISVAYSSCLPLAGRRSDYTDGQGYKSIAATTSSSKDHLIASNHAFIMRREYVVIFDDNVDL